MADWPEKACESCFMIVKEYVDVAEMPRPKILMSSSNMRTTSRWLIALLSYLSDIHCQLAAVPVLGRVANNQAAC